MKTLVIGYGSPIRGDDAIGPLTADALEARRPHEDVKVIARHVLTAELVADLAGQDLVIFLDAAVDLPAGAVRCARLEPDESAVSTMAHFLDPRELLAWTQTLYRHSPEAYLITAGGESFDYACYELTTAAQPAVDKMIAVVGSLIAERLEPSAGTGHLSSGIACTLTP